MCRRKASAAAGRDFPQRRRIRRKQALPLQSAVTAPSREKANRENPQIFPIRK